MPSNRTKSFLLSNTSAESYANCRRKYQGSDKRKRQGTIVDLLFMLIIRAKKAPQEQDGRPCGDDAQSDDRCTERWNPTFKADSDDGEKRGEIEECERGSATADEFISKGLTGQGDLP